MHSPCHRRPQAKLARRTGMKSFAAIVQSRQTTNHCNCSQCSRRKTPQPHKLEASESICSVGGCETRVRREHVPLHLTRKVSHRSRSARASEFSQTQYCRRLTRHDTSIRRQRKHLPTLNTDASCCRIPTNNSRSLLVQKQRPSQSLTI